MAKILLVEDDQLLLEVYKRGFVEAGFDVATAKTGREAILAVQQTSYDLVVLDILLPDTNGLEVFRQMRQNPSTRDIPVIFVTSLSDEETMKKAMALGAKGYLSKATFSPDMIVREVKKFLKID